MTTRRSGLGRGLESLIPTEEPAPVGDRYLQVPVDAIVPNPNQPRTHFDDDSLEELTQSIKAVGVLQPVVVIEGDEEFELVAGERRWRAALRAGLTTLPAIVRPRSPGSTLTEALIENVQRQDLAPLEEALAYRQLLEESGMTQEDLASRVGKSRAAISNTIRLLQLPAPVQDLVEDGRLSPGHARALLGLEDQAYAAYLGEKAAREQWSVRQVEDAVRSRKEMSQPAARRSVREMRPVQIIELEKRLSQRLGNPVKIRYRDAKGRIEIRFSSLEELESVYRVFTD